MPSFGHRLDGLVEAMSEAVAETDEELMEKFFSGEAFTQEELQRGVKAGIKSGSITPVFCGSSTKLDCIDAMLHYMKPVSYTHLPHAAGDRPGLLRPGAGPGKTSRQGDGFSARRI